MGDAAKHDQEENKVCPATQPETKRVYADLDKDLHIKFRVLTMQRDKTIAQAVEEGIKLWMEAELMKQ